MQHNSYSKLWRSYEKHRKKETHGYKLFGRSHLVLQKANGRSVLKSEISVLEGDDELFRTRIPSMETYFEDTVWRCAVEEIVRRENERIQTTTGETIKKKRNCQKEVMHDVQVV